MPINYLLFCGRTGEEMSESPYLVTMFKTRRLSNPHPYNQRWAAVKNNHFSVYDNEFWPRVRARALRAPVFLPSFTGKMGRCATPPPPPPIAASLILQDINDVLRKPSEKSPKVHVIVQLLLESHSSIIQSQVAL
jgi:hypothetical protein